MSERIGRIVNERKGSGGQPFRCAWMDHWMQPKYSMEKRSGGGIRIEELHSASIGSVKGLKVTEAAIVETVSDSLHSKSCGEDSSSISKGGTSMNPLAWMKTRVPKKDKVFVEAKPLREMELSAHVVPYRSDFERHELEKGKAVVSFSNNELSLGSADLTRKRKMPSQSESDNSLNAGGFRDENSSFTFDAPSTSDNSLKQFGQEWFQKMQNRSFIGLFPNQCIDLEKTNSKKSDFHDVETMRISTTIEETRGGCPRFSQTTHSLLITKKTVTDTSNDLHNLPPLFGKANQGLKIQSLSSSNDSEVKINVGDVKASKVTLNNESSTDTDTLDMDFNEKNQPLGSRSTSPIKALNMEQYLLPPVAVASSREVGHRCMNKELPDINLEPPSLPNEDFFSENAGLSSSRTQSFEMDMFRANVDQSKPKFNLDLNDSNNISDPCNRWVKRLKMRSSNNNTDSPNLAQDTSHGRNMSKFFSTILKNSISSSNPDQILSDKVGELHVDAIEKVKDLSLSKAWIKRWLSNESRIETKKAEDLAVSELQSSKMAIEDIEKKQFPSIGAMALMGKAMGGFQQSELRKRGAVTVWNTKAF